MISDNVRHQLDKEVKLGSGADRAYATFIRDFVQSKKLVLFQAFNDIPISNTEDLQETKRMMATLDSLELEILTVIETGRLAKVQLSEPSNGN